MNSIDQQKASYLKNLNAEQLQAVTSEARHQLVLAGAGSGKTRVLTHRIAWLVDKKTIHPRHILAVTFTNKAAREMRRRIEEHLGPQIGRLWIGTFHAIALKLLKIHWQNAGLNENFRILDAADQLRLVKQLCRDNGYEVENYAKQTCAYINKAKERSWRSASVPNNMKQKPNATVCQELYQQYEKFCEAEGLVDFAELLLRAVELWEHNSDILSHYQERFRYVLIDEFQDTNALQYQWITQLCAERSSLMVVGDDDQSIYRWRGARVENILEFDSQFESEGVEVVALQQNYRSTATVLRAANAVISKNSRRHPKELWTKDQEGEPITVYCSWDEEDEARFVVEQLKQMREEGRPYSDAAVIYRSHAQSRVLEDKLLQAGIVYKIHGGQRFYDRQEIRDIVAWLRLLINPHDNQAFERAAVTPKRGVGQQSWARLRALSETHALSYWDLLGDPAHAESLRPQVRKSLLEFRQLIERFQKELGDEQKLQQIVEYTIHQSGVYEHYQQQSKNEGEGRMENLKELVNACAQFDEQQESLSLAEFLDQTALDAGDPERGEDNAVQMMTIHAAKGLEFPQVMVIGMEENLLPHSNSLDNEDQLEEERRLCYVAITRTMQKLTLVYARNRRLYGNMRGACKPSRFLLDIPKDLQLNLGNGFSDSFRQQTSASAPINGSVGAAPSIEGFALGAKVSHKKFGEGTVMGLEGQGEHARVRVHFKEAGHKWLILSYAALQVDG